MPVVTVEGVSDPIVTEQGRRLVLAIEDAGIDILHRCGGNARCTTCRVDILAGDPGPMTDPEAARLSRVEDLTPSMRLPKRHPKTDPLSLPHWPQSTT